MRFALWVAVVAGCALGQADVEREDIRDVQRVFKSTNPALDTFHPIARKPLIGSDAEAGVAVLLVEASTMELRAGYRFPSPVGGSAGVGVFLVEGPTNRVRRTIDVFPVLSEPEYPVLDPPTAHAIYLHLYGSYGLYQGSIKYIYELAKQAPPVKIRYGKLALTSSTVENGKIEYTASFASGGGLTGELPKGWIERHARITIEPHGGDALPAFQIVDAPAVDGSYKEPAPIRAANGETVLIANQTPPGQQDQPSVIYVTGQSGQRQAYPAPVTTQELYRRARPEHQEPGEIENDIGPYVVEGARLWFASTFYDGEGVSGVGAIGLFDFATHRYEMKYLPEIAPWSGSAMRLDADELWVGLMRRPEGANIPGGLLRYNIRTGAVKTYPVADYVYTLDAIDGTLYCGTSNGVYTIRGDAVAKLRFEPDGQGKTIMVPD